MKSVLAAAGLVVLTPACVEVEEVPTEPVAAYGKDCGEMVCGNAAEIDDQPFWELDESMVQFSPIGGFRITNFKKAAQELTLIVAGDELIGVPVLGGPPLQRELLVGATIDIEQFGNATQYRLTITSYKLEHQIEDPGVPRIDIPTFQFKYAPLGANRNLEFLCPDDGNTVFQRMAIVYQGDRYDSFTGEVVDTGANAEPWFNIACNTSALWKMELFRYTEATEDAAHDTDEDSRTAALRSIMSDYCGIGHPFTVYGTPVDWRNDDFWLTMSAGLVTEALWTRDGAVCLTNPRYATQAQVGEYCDLDPCTPAQMLGWFNNFEMYTKVPP